MKDILKTYFNAVDNFLAALRCALIDGVPTVFGCFASEQSEA